MVVAKKHEWVVSPEESVPTLHRKHKGAKGLTGSSRRRASRPETWQFYARVGALFVISLALAFLIVAREAHISRLGYRIVELKDLVAETTGEVQSLEMEIARLEELGRVEVVAAQLGLSRPVETRVALVDQPPSPPAASQSIVLTEGNQGSSGSRKGLLTRFSRHVYAWLTGSRAEAKSLE